MFTRLTLDHFKTWTRADLTFGKLTGLFGTNSSGKSSLIQFFLLLKQTRDATDRRLALHFGDDRTRTRLGSFEDVVQNHDTSLTLDWRLDWNAPEPIRLENPARAAAVAEGTEVSLAASVRLKDDEPMQTRLSYALGGRSFALVESGHGFTEIETTGRGAFSFKRTRGRPIDFGSPTKGYLFPDAARLAYQNAGFLSFLESAYEKQMDRLFYLGPLRDYPKREYSWSGAPPPDVGDKGEFSIEAILAATRRDARVAVPGQRRFMRFEEAVGFWLKRLGLIASFTARPVAKGSNIYRALVCVRKGGPEVPLTDVGFGISQVLPVITLLHYVPEGSTVILEQPEIHLHPLAQAELADLLIDVSKSRRVQIIVESHSEHLLLRLQRRIAEQQMVAEDVRLYFAHPVGNESALDPLELDLLGNIGNWPEKFMGDAFTETAEAELARLRRMKATG